MNNWNWSDEQVVAVVSAIESGLAKGQTSCKEVAATVGLPKAFGALIVSNMLATSRVTGYKTLTKSGIVREDYVSPAKSQKDEAAAKKEQREIARLAKVLGSTEKAVAAYQAAAAVATPVATA